MRTKGLPLLLLALACSGGDDPATDRADDDTSAPGTTTALTGPAPLGDGLVLEVTPPGPLTSGGAHSLTVTLSSDVEVAGDARLTVWLPPDVEPVAGETDWTGPLLAGEDTSLALDLQVPDDGVHRRISISAVGDDAHRQTHAAQQVVPLFPGGPLRVDNQAGSEAAPLELALEADGPLVRGEEAELRLVATADHDGATVRLGFTLPPGTTVLQGETESLARSLDQDESLSLSLRIRLPDEGDGLAVGGFAHLGADDFLELDGTGLLEGGTEVSLEVSP